MRRMEEIDRKQVWTEDKHSIHTEKWSHCVIFFFFFVLLAALNLNCCSKISVSQGVY